MSRTTLAALVAALIGLCATRDAGAQIIFTTSNAAFTTSTNFASQPNQGPGLSNVNVGGSTLLSSPGRFISGLLFPGTSLTFTNLNNGAGVTGFGMSVSNSTIASVSSATFSNGDTYSTSQSLTSGGFFGYTSATPFTSVTLNFTGLTLILSDYRVINATAVPEPSTLLSGAMVVLTACGAAVLRRGKRTAPALPSDDRPAAV